MKSTRILVTVANGQLGSEIRAVSGNYPAFDFFFTTRQELDICDPQAVEEYVILKNINSIINCAAYTAVDKAESEPELADKINHLAVKGLAEIARKYEIRFIHISTDYVFDGNKNSPYIETDLPNPQTVYGASKLAGENAVRAINPKNSIIIRTSWVYSRFGNNFVKTMLRLGKERDEINVVSDQVGSPTNAADLAKAILTILPQLENDTVEIFHYSSEGVCTWYDFAREIIKIAKIGCLVKPISTSDYSTPAIRPLYSQLDKSKIKGRFYVSISNWKNLCENNFLNDINS